jgi:hypothetical protein
MVAALFYDHPNIVDDLRDTVYHLNDAVVEGNKD